MKTDQYNKMIKEFSDAHKVNPDSVILYKSFANVDEIPCDCCGVTKERKYVYFPLILDGEGIEDVAAYAKGDYDSEVFVSRLKGFILGTTCVKRFKERLREMGVNTRKVRTYE